MPTLRSALKRLTPRPLRRLYNRLVSRRIISRKLGDWFDLEWNRRAHQAEDRDWVRTYDASWEHWAQPDLSPEDIERIADRAGGCASLLDAGCGDGYLLEGLEKRAATRAGVDLSRTGLLRARRRLGHGPLLVQAFLESLPFADDAFEVVVSAHTLEHVRDLQGAIRELIRVARRRLVILVPSQEEALYTEDYHLHYFPREKDLLDAVGLPDAVCERFTVPQGRCAYSGDILLLTADLG